MQRKQQFQQQYGTGLLPPNAQIQGGNRNPTTDHFEYIYEHDDTLMYKNATTRILDDSIGDIRHEISDMQRIILLQVEDELLECEPGWQQLADMLASLDATMSLGIVANERNFVRPDISENKTIAVKGGRHPLQELTVDRYIANDIFLHEEKHIAIVTGANSSGKSVYLKQIGTCLCGHVARCMNGWLSYPIPKKDWIWVTTVITTVCRITNSSSSPLTYTPSPHTYHTPHPLTSQVLLCTWHILGVLCLVRKH